jgi:AcrR family transcriptional regulator
MAKTQTEGDERQAGRPRDPGISDAISAAALRLLNQDGFARMSIEALASEAGVGKPAIYRRFRGKAEVVAWAIAQQLPDFEIPDVGDARAETHRVMYHGLPPDGRPYMGLIGGLMAEYKRHPELVQAFQEHVLLPRRVVAETALIRGQKRGEVRRDLDPEMMVDLLVGPFYARIIAGLDTGTEWRERSFELWWESVRARDSTPALAARLRR